MGERILVAVDGGPASAAALAWAGEHASSTDAEVEIVTVIDALGLPSEVQADVKSYYEKELTEAKATVLESAPDSEVSTRILTGRPAEELVEASRRVDMIVIGTNKTSPIIGIMHGTLALKIAGEADCITVVVPVDWQPKRGDVVVGWTNDTTSDEALDFAAREAVRTGRGLTIVHTWSAVAPTEVSGAAIVVQQLVTAGTRLLSDAAERVRRNYPTLTVTKLLHAGSAAVAIVRAADAASLVVVGSRGRGAIAGFFLGSVIHDVLQNMPAPVAVIPKKTEPIDVYPELVEEDA